MAVKLLGYYSTHIWKWKELYALYMFRKMREQEKYRILSVKELSECVGRKIKADSDTVESTIKKWMFQIPLELLPRCAYQDVLAEIHRLRKSGCKIYIYSDYPAKEKVDILQLHAEDIFTAEDDDIHELKPSRKAMQVILKKVGVNPSQIQFIGDRDEKDGESAKLLSMDYCNVKEWRKRIKRKADYE